MIKTGDTCIRVFANVGQINDCIKLLDQKSESISKISKISRYAGNETRFKILYLIYKEKEMCVCDLSDILNISVSAVSQHLRKLKDRNLLEDRKAGQIIFYNINEDCLKILLPIFIHISKNKIKEEIRKII